MNDNIIIISIACPFCGKAHEVEVFEGDYLDWQKGKLAQDAFPYLDATQREELISGLCPECQADIFGSEDEPSDADFEEYGDPDMGFDPYMGCYTDDC